MARRVGPRLRGAAEKTFRRAQRLAQDSHARLHPKAAHHTRLARPREPARPVRAARYRERRGVLPRHDGTGYRDGTPHRRRGALHAQRAGVCGAPLVDGHRGTECGGSGAPHLRLRRRLPRRHEERDLRLDRDSRERHHRRTAPAPHDLRGPSDTNGREPLRAPRATRRLPRLELRPDACPQGRRPLRKTQSEKSRHHH